MPPLAVLNKLERVLYVEEASNLTSQEHGGVTIAYVSDDPKTSRHTWGAA